MRKIGKSGKIINEKTLFKFERTSVLIDKGICKYIRHPLISSLFFLTWGMFFKNTTNLLFLSAFFSTVFLNLTAIFDEKRYIKFFGNNYSEYMKRSKRFIPFII